MRGDLLQLTGPPGPAGATAVVSAGDNTMVALGGRATLSIGASSQSVEADPEPRPDVRIYVPAATPLAISGLVGDLSVEGVGGTAERASEQLAGVGKVAIDQVRARPQVSVLGIGEVAIGNWWPPGSESDSSHQETYDRLRPKARTIFGGAHQCSE